MIVTVTTTTAVGLTTESAEWLTLIVILTLIGLQIKKELISGLEGRVAQRLSHSLNLAIVPLFVVFLATVAMKVAAVLH